MLIDVDILERRAIMPISAFPVLERGGSGLELTAPTDAIRAGAKERGE